MEQSPTTSFQSVLGYTNDQGSGTGLIDNINCQGNTNTSSAISVAYNELWKMNEPGALNVIVLETDGLPNTMTLNFWDSSNSVVGAQNRRAARSALRADKFRGRAISPFFIHFQDQRTAIGGFPRLPSTARRYLWESRLSFFRPEPKRALSHDAGGCATARTKFLHP